MTICRDASAWKRRKSTEVATVHFQTSSSGSHRSSSLASRARACRDDQDATDPTDLHDWESGPPTPVGRSEIRGCSGQGKALRSGWLGQWLISLLFPHAFFRTQGCRRKSHAGMAVDGPRIQTPFACPRSHTLREGFGGGLGRGGVEM